MVRRRSRAAYTLALGLVSLHCGGSDGSYDASVADIRDDVRLTLSVAADGSGKLSLNRWYGSKAYGWEHCPRIHAAGTVSGRPLQLVEAGGWVPPSGGGFLEGDGGACRDMLYRFGSDALVGLAGTDVVFRIEDEGGAIELQTPYLGGELTLALVAPTMDTLIPGQHAEIALLPGAAALDLSACSFSYRGELAHKTLVQQYAWFDVQPPALEPTERGLAFVTPQANESRGSLKLDCHRGGIWPAGIARCEGVHGCAATRNNPAAIELEVSVSASGVPVTVDPTEDPAGWSPCWLSAGVTGGTDQTIALDGDDGCSGGLRTGASTMSMSWGSFASATRAALRVTGIAALDLATEFPAALELTVGKDTWMTSDGACRVELTRVELDTTLTTQDNYVVQGTGRCTELVSPAPSNQLSPLKLDPFQFRAGVGKTP
jgi:hypothetical protein